MHIMIEFSITLFIIVLFAASVSGRAPNIDKDEYAIHRACNHRTQFTRKELEDAKRYLQSRFRNGASVYPQRAPCESLKVVRDFRCLSDSERHSFVNAFRKVFVQTEFINDLSYYHTFYWPHTNLFASVIPWHIKVIRETIRSVENFGGPMAYWDVTMDGGKPEKALVWDYVGHAGNEHNDYCVPDGPFSGLTLEYPNNTCLKREWKTDCTMNVWETPEVLTLALQQGDGSLQVYGPQMYAAHFKKHMSIGGLAGDMGNTQATNEPCFYMFHAFDAYVNILKWQLENDTSLVDLFWNNYGKYIPPYTYNGTVVQADLEHDKLLYGYDTTTVAEAFTFGFGEFCYIPDRVIEAILSVLSNRRPRYPVAVQRLRDALPSDLFAKYFPLFADNTATEFNYHLPNVGYTNRRCKPIPIPPDFDESEVGRQQFARFKQTGVDLQPFALLGQQQIRDFITDLNRYGYCSPYIY